MRQQVLWKVQNRYVQERTSTSLDRLDVLVSLEAQQAKKALLDDLPFFAEYELATTVPLRAPPTAASRPITGATTTTSASTFSTSLRAAGSKVIGGNTTARSAKAVSTARPGSSGSRRDRDPDVLRIEQESLDFLENLQKRGYRYRSPFTGEDEYFELNTTTAAK